MQERHKSNANALELHLSCSYPWILSCMFMPCTPHGVASVGSIYELAVDLMSPPARLLDSGSGRLVCCGSQHVWYTPLQGAQGMGYGWDNVYNSEVKERCGGAKYWHHNIALVRKCWEVILYIISNNYWNTFCDLENIISGIISPGNQKLWFTLYHLDNFKGPILIYHI